MDDILKRLDCIDSWQNSSSYVYPRRNGSHDLRSFHLPRACIGYNLFSKPKLSLCVSGEHLLSANEALGHTTTD